MMIYQKSASSKTSSICSITDLWPNPRQETPWQALYDNQNAHAFITTMGFDPLTFQLILVALMGPMSVS
jgi:hypothetical protein